MFCYVLLNMSWSWSARSQGILHIPHVRSSEFVVSPKSVSAICNSHSIQENFSSNILKITTQPQQTFPVSASFLVLLVIFGAFGYSPMTLWPKVSAFIPTKKDLRGRNEHTVPVGIALSFNLEKCDARGLSLTKGYLQNPSQCCLGLRQPSCPRVPAHSLPWFQQCQV